MLKEVCGKQAQEKKQGCIEGGCFQPGPRREKKREISSCFQLWGFTGQSRPWERDRGKNVEKVKKKKKW